MLGLFQLKEFGLEEKRLEFFRLLDDLFVDFYWDKIKITKGEGRHTCCLCKNWLQKRKMKLVGVHKLNQDANMYMLCFGCWGDYKTWEKVEGRAKEPKPVKEFKFTMPVNRWRF